jgi:hypothetical protein
MIGQDQVRRGLLHAKFTSRGVDAALRLTGPSINIGRSPADIIFIRQLDP